MIDEKNERCNRVDSSPNPHNAQLYISVALRAQLLFDPARRLVIEFKGRDLFHIRPEPAALGDFSRRECTVS